MNWDDLKKFHLSPPEIPGLIPRSLDEQLKYDKHMAKISKKDLNDSIIKREFPDMAKAYSISLNSFPYDLESNIDHYIVWINPVYYESFTTELIEYITCLFIETNNYKDKIYFRNRPGVTSVKFVPHLQFFCLR